MMPQRHSVAVTSNGNSKKSQRGSGVLAILAALVVISVLYQLYSCVSRPLRHEVLAKNVCIGGQSHVLFKSGSDYQIAPLLVEGKPEQCTAQTPPGIQKLCIDGGAYVNFKDASDSKIKTSPLLVDGKPVQCTTQTSAK